MDHERVSNYPWIRSQCAERSVTRAEFDALTQRVNTDEWRAWDANARINDAVFDLTRRVAALEVAQADRDFDGHDAACARGIEMAAEALARVAALDATHNVGTHRRDADIVSVPGYPGKENPTRREELAGRVTAPPAAPSLLPCPFCGGPATAVRDFGAECQACDTSCQLVEVWNRRTPADARLRALALEVADSATPGNIADLRAYLRETAR